MSDEYQYIFKIIVVGSSGVGKTSLISRYVDQSHPTSYISTIGVDFKIKTFKLGDETIKLQLWDTAGQERFRTITTSYYRGAHGIIIVYDLTDNESLEGVKSWLAEVESSIIENAEIIIIGNKCDLKDDEQPIDSFAGHTHLTTSAKENVRVDEMFNVLCTRLVEKVKSGNLVVGEKSKGVDVKDLMSNSKKYGCC